MDDKTENNLKSKKTWKRLIYIILYAICFNVAEIVLAAIAIVQFFSTLITGAPLNQLQRFGTALGQYIHELVDFLTQASDNKPFPIGNWPEEKVVSSTNEDSDDDSTIVVTPAPPK
ncbi:DUF4389 domain-containing protein [Sneathiella sp.]|jgi:hypothetical protein|uniref:DUF4389 domain-containing protein n=1 Tax=Sneathiella sp. TaxID=1964365 RepID=UPI0039E32470